MGQRMLAQGDLQSLQCWLYLDLVGLDVAQSIGNTIGADVPARIDALVAEGALGRKSGRGFYTYSNVAGQARRLLVTAPSATSNV